MSEERLARLNGKIIDFRLRPPTGAYRNFFTPNVVGAVNRVLGHAVPRSYHISTEPFAYSEEHAIRALIDEMDSVGVRLGVMNGRHSVNRPVPVHIEDNDLVELTKRSGKRIVGLAGVDLDKPMPEILKELDTAINELDLVGVCIEPGLARTPIYADDEKLFPLYERIAALNVPLLFMSGPLAGPDISHTDPVRFDRVARRYSTIPVVLGHGCYPYVNEAIALAFKSEVTGIMNVYVSPDVYIFAPGGNAYVEGINFMPNRFIFASAYSFCGVDTAVRGTLKLPIKDEALDAYMYRNAEALLRTAAEAEMTERNMRIVMKRHPQGMVSEDDFAMIENELPALQPGQALVRNRFLSLDPYMRPRMDPLRSYVEPLKPGDLMPGATVGEVIDSRADDLPKGTMVAAAAGWQSHGVVTKAAVRVLDPAIGSPSAALGVLGMTGVTAHYGLLALAKPKAGETVVVTAASGAVGGIVGQIAKIQGCHVIGIAGGAEKCRYVVEELGFDACINHRAPDFEQQLAAATPNYVNVLFENVGGPILDAVLQRIADHARIVLCGNISQYNAEEPYGLKGLRQLLMHRVTLYAFIIADHRDYWPTALVDLGRWLKEGKLKFKEDVAEGLRSAPAAFIRMLTGKNFGKQLIHLD